MQVRDLVQHFFFFWCNLDCLLADMPVVPLFVVQKKKLLTHPFLFLLILSRQLLAFQVVGVLPKCPLSDHSHSALFILICPCNSTYIFIWSLSPVSLRHIHKTPWSVLRRKTAGWFICFWHPPPLILAGVMRALVMGRWWTWRRRTRTSSTVTAQAAGTQYPTSQGKGKDKERPAPVNSPKIWQRWTWRLQVSKPTSECMRNTAWDALQPVCLGRLYWTAVGGVYVCIYIYILHTVFF